MVCCCSSVVERILGKAEVGSSILPSSTIPSRANRDSRHRAPGGAKCPRFRAFHAGVVVAFRTETPWFRANFARFWALVSKADIGVLCPNAPAFGASLGARQIRGVCAGRPRLQADHWRAEGCARSASTGWRPWRMAETMSGARNLRRARRQRWLRRVGPLHAGECLPVVPSTQMPQNIVAAMTEPDVIGLMFRGGRRWPLPATASDIAHAKR